MGDKYSKRIFGHEYFEIQGFTESRLEEKKFKQKM